VEERLEALEKRIAEVESELKKERENGWKKFLIAELMSVEPPCIIGFDSAEEAYRQMFYRCLADFEERGTVKGDTPPKGELQEIEYFNGEKGLYYPYVDPQPEERVSHGTTKRAIGVDKYGRNIYEYTTNHGEALNHYCREWLANRQATGDTVQGQS